ncbi:MAG: penicillin-binding transpeptidase domain-containing protein [Mycoplasmatales bacterium]
MNSSKKRGKKHVNVVKKKPEKILGIFVKKPSKKKTNVKTSSSKVNGATVTSKQMKTTKPKIKNVNKTFVKKKNTQKNKRIIKPVKIRREYTVESYNRLLKKRSDLMMKVAFSLFSALFILPIVMIVYLQVTHTRNGENLKVYAANRTIETELAADRGTIYSSNGIPLATNIGTFNVYAVLDKTYKQPEELGGKPLYIVDAKKATEFFLETIGLKGDQEAYDFIYKQLTMPDVKQVELGKYGKDISFDQKVKLEDFEKSGITGFYTTKGTKRFYPYGNFAPYLIGATSTVEQDPLPTGIVRPPIFKGIPGFGLEDSANTYLTGKNGYEKKTVDNNNVKIEGTVSIKEEPIPGKSIRTTIDPVIQTYLQEEMEKALNEPNAGYTFERLATVIMNPKTGQIYAAQSYPNFDPNTQNAEDYTDPFMGYCFEPGSTMKTFTVAAAVENGVYDPDNWIETTGRRPVDGGTVVDWVNSTPARTFGGITWEEGYYYSSNVAMSYILQKIGYDNWLKFQREKLLFGKPIKTPFYSTTACGFSPELRGSSFDIISSSYGQAVTVNMMQMLQAYSTIGNNGIMSVPYVVDATIDSNTGKVLETFEPQQKQVLKPETATEMLKKMEGVSYSGLQYTTGQRYIENFAEPKPNYHVGVKTGTAENIDSTGAVKSLTNSVMAFAPIDDPEILVYSFVVDGRGNAGQEAVAIKAMPQYVDRVIQKTVEYLDSSKLKQVKEIKDQQKISDVSNKKLDEAQAILQKDGFKVIKIGEGNVVSQAPSANQTIVKGQKVIIIGEKAKMPDLVGYLKPDVRMICSAMNVACEFTGSGEKVTKVEVDKNKVYKIKF